MLKKLFSERGYFEPTQGNSHYTCAYKIAYMISYLYENIG